MAEPVAGNIRSLTEGAECCFPLSNFILRLDWPEGRRRAQKPTAVACWKDGASDCRRVKRDCLSRITSH